LAIIGLGLLGLRLWLKKRGNATAKAAKEYKDRREEEWI
jgi:hypothetical protein